MTSSIGLSPISPPWTSLTAYDLNQGIIKWTMPLGEVPDLRNNAPVLDPTKNGLSVGINERLTGFLLYWRILPDDIIQTTPLLAPGVESGRTVVLFS
ncbi:MAG TPA: hypothetical protein VK604_01875 [Bryobacteraceae bacterium]|nr:hypothetical protein [Bryobacteraceae bacterium]